MASSCQTTEEKPPHNFCLKWSNYHTHILGVLIQLFKSETMVDVTLCASGGEKVGAHRVILCAASSYFQEILSCSEESHPIVILSEVSVEDINSILQFVYHGELNVDASQLPSVLQVAASLQIKGLMEVSEQLPTLVSIEGDCDTLGDETELPALVPIERNCQDLPEDETVYTQELDSNTDAVALENANNNLQLEKVKYQSIANKSSRPQSEIHFSKQLNEGEVLEEVYQENNDSRKEILQFITQDKKKRKKYDHTRRDYSEEQLTAALSDLSAGHMLTETSVTHQVPRSTLYARAKAAGISLSFSRQEHSGERVQAAVEAVTNGSSLQQASLLYQIPKTVLWRRVKAAGGRESWIRHKGQSYAQRQAAIQALQNGQKLSKVSAQFQIPKTTLFREKIRLVESGKLPWSSLKKRDPQSCAVKHSRIKEAVAACKEGKMSQATAAMTFQVPKTTIWRRLQKSYSTIKKSEEAETSNSAALEENPCPSPASATARLQEQVPFTFCENNTQLPVAFIVADTDFSETALII